MTEREAYMIQVIRYLSETIGGRGSCTPEQRRAGEYVLAELRRLGGADIRLEPFAAIPSTYWPYGLAFGAALAGSLAGLVFGGRIAMAVGALCNALGAWGFLAESDLVSSWTHWFLPRVEAQNVAGKISPAGERRQRVVLAAHLDTHRTPVFYSSNAWQALFTALLGLAVASMLAGTLGFGLGAALGWGWMRWLGLALALVQAFALGLCLHADRTPYSPGANDNASGAAVALAIASRLQETLLEHTEVYFVFTDCEEAGDQGMEAYLQAHAAELGDEAFYVAIDQVGAGRIKFLSADGLLIKRPTHPAALGLARRVVAQRPDLEASEGVGLAYTDALKATRQGLRALTLCTIPRDAKNAGAHWHQMSDTLEHIFPLDLEKTYEFTWELLRALDRSSVR